MTPREKLIWLRKLVKTWPVTACTDAMVLSRDSPHLGTIREVSLLLCALAKEGLLIPQMNPIKEAHQPLFIRCHPPADLPPAYLDTPQDGGNRPTLV